MIGSSKEHLAWSQMQRMSASGLVRLESHSHFHRNCVANVDTLKKDAVDLRIC